MKLIVSKKQLDVLVKSINDLDSLKKLIHLSRIIGRNYNTPQS